VLYIGVTSDLIKRVWQHKEKITKGFSSRYRINRLVYYEIHNTAEHAIIREKKLKKWKRQWKLDLIEKENFQWRDLYLEIIG
jgi:putative endonuclease